MYARPHVTGVTWTLVLTTPSEADHRRSARGRCGGEALWIMVFKGLTTAEEQSLNAGEKNVRTKRWELRTSVPRVVGVGMRASRQRGSHNNTGAPSGANKKAHRFSGG